jgi:hypothetical protein
VIKSSLAISLVGLEQKPSFSETVSVTIIGELWQRQKVAERWNPPNWRSWSPERILSHLVAVRASYTNNIPWQK